MGRPHQASDAAHPPRPRRPIPGTWPEAAHRVLLQWPGPPRWRPRGSLFSCDCGGTHCPAGLPRAHTEPAEPTRGKAQTPRPYSEVRRSSRSGEDALGVLRPAAPASPYLSAGRLSRSRRLLRTHLKAGEAANRQTAPGYFSLFSSFAGVLQWSQQVICLV
ncbi:hypothetical protein NDU88_003340 [Pleurodeles waltl]|uniref:Uncharacterized protein n=1 Tax=Pleurodeles waltl TaxID=8319 RepID=A0AAV7VF40_PLEWA|nr:hypothetical protein NDU88_003340 [Pleurodeles waltl]